MPGIWKNCKFLSLKLEKQAVKSFACISGKSVRLAVNPGARNFSDQTHQRKSVLVQDVSVKHLSRALYNFQSFFGK